MHGGARFSGRLHCVATWAVGDDLKKPTQHQGGEGGTQGGWKRETAGASWEKCLPDVYPSTPRIGMADEGSAVATPALRHESSPFWTGTGGFAVGAAFDTHSSRIFTLLTRQRDWQPSAPGRPMMTSGRAELTSASFSCALGRRHSRADEVVAVTHGHVFLTPLREVS